MDRSKWRSYLQTTLKVDEHNANTAVDNKSRLQKEKNENTQKIFVIVIVSEFDTVTNGLDS